METDYIFKLVLVGDHGVGKSALLQQYTEKTFSLTGMSTIGVDFKVKTLDMGKDGQVKLQIWDTAGQERFRTIVSAYYRGIDGLIVVYDVTNRNSFEHVIHWLREAQYYGFHDNNYHCSYLLVGNKTDLTRVVTFQEGQALANKLAIPYIETSAKNTTNVEEAFMTMAHQLLEVRRRNCFLINDTSYGSFQLPISEGTDVEDSWYNYYRPSCC